MTHWTAYENSHGLKAGDILVVRNSGQLVRYVGLAKNGLPDTVYDKDLLTFSGAVPLHPFNQSDMKWYYFATKDSSSQGFVDPSIVKGLEKVTFLNGAVKDLRKDLEKVGNIPQLLWMRMEQEAPHIRSVFPPIK